MLRARVDMVADQQSQHRADAKLDEYLDSPKSGFWDRMLQQAWACEPAGQPGARCQKIRKFDEGPPHEQDEWEKRRVTVENITVAVVQDGELTPLEELEVAAEEFVPNKLHPKFCVAGAILSKLINSSVSFCGAFYNFRTRRRCCYHVSQWQAEALQKSYFSGV